jgi:preprotein translocase subunit SecA
LAQNIDALLARFSADELSEDDLVDLLVNLSQGSRMAIDPRTHQRVMRRVTLLNYIFLAAKLQQGNSPAQITEHILDHLEEAQELLETVWGKMELERFRLADLPLAQLDPHIKQGLSEELGEARAAEVEALKPESLSQEERDTLASLMGQRIQNGIYRHILVSVISELWVEHLTRVDALRVSIGLEAFAQRDPLVQYKAKATEMFAELLSSIRAGVISRMFLFQPRRATGPKAEEKKAPTVSVTAAAQPAQDADQQKKKRKRH